MKRKLLATALLISTCVTSWAWFSPSITQAKVNQIRIGQTTEVQLLHLFGAPTTRMIDVRHQVELQWFRSRPMSPAGYLPLIGSFVGGLNIEAQELYVLLSSNGTVLRFTAYSSTGSLRAPEQTVVIRRQTTYAK